MIVLFKVALVLLMSTNTDLQLSVTNSGKIDCEFTSFCYFVDKLISAFFTALQMQERQTGCMLRPIYLVSPHMYRLKHI